MLNCIKRKIIYLKVESLNNFYIYKEKTDRDINNLKHDKNLSKNALD